MAKSALKHKRVFAGIAVLCLALSACKFKLRPTYPADRIASALRHMCAQDYKLSVETRHESGSLQTMVWKVGLFKGRSYELQGMSREALETLNHVLLCATRIALSTDARLQFIEIQLADVVTGSTVVLWRYVPDIRDSMYQRFGDTEYFSRLVFEIRPGPAESHKSGIRLDHLPGEMPWNKPLTMSEFLAKQIILRAKREGAELIEAHPDLSDPNNLNVIIDNWEEIADAGPDHMEKVTSVVHKSAKKVLSGYQFNGFRSMVLRDAGGLALKRWTL